MGLLKTNDILLLFFICLWCGQIFANELTNVEKTAMSCFACHGDKGNSTNKSVPKLAGQQAIYLVKQLKAFKSGTRQNAIMQTQVSNLSDEDINNYGAYFTVQVIGKTEVDPSLVQTGKDKASQCLGCHGSNGEGNGQYPRLAGQHSDYLIQQLLNFKNGQRMNGPMQAIAGVLSKEDITAIAVFFSSL